MIPALAETAMAIHPPSLPPNLGEQLKKIKNATNILEKSNRKFKESKLFSIHLNLYVHETHVASTTCTFLEDGSKRGKKCYIWKLSDVPDQYHGNK